MGQNTDPQTPEEKAANKKELQNTLSKAYWSGELTQEQADKVWASGVIDQSRGKPANYMTQDDMINSGFAWSLGQDAQGNEINTNMQDGPFGSTREFLADKFGGQGQSLGGPPSGNQPMYTGPPIGVDADDIGGPRGPAGGGGGGGGYTGGGGGLEFGSGVNVGGVNWDEGMASGATPNNLFRASDNADFYNLQAGAMMSKQLRNSMREERARGISNEAAQNPAAATPTDWSWANDGRGLPDRSGGGMTPGGGAAPGGGGAGGYNLNPLVQKGMSGNEMIGALGGIWNEDENAWWQAQSDDWKQGVGQAMTFDSPQAYMAAVRDRNPDLGAEGMAHYQKLANNVFQQQGIGGGGGSAPPGYASPV